MSFARVRALVVVGVLAVAAVVFVITALVKDTQGGPTNGATCADSAPRADMDLPDDPVEITLKVYNGTETAGLADRVTTEFKNRRFVTKAPAESKTKYNGVAEIRFGPDGVGKAQLLRAYFLGQSKMEYSAKRKGPLLEVVIGSGFRQLATTTEVNQSLIDIGNPTLPAGACAKPSTKKKKDGEA